VKTPQDMYDGFKSLMSLAVTLGSFVFILQAMYYEYHGQDFKAQNALLWAIVMIVTMIRYDAPKVP
jgi:hypothetical protein